MLLLGQWRNPDNHINGEHLMSYNFTKSTAITSISDVVENKVNITWKSGSTYTYTLSDAEKFISNLTEIISSGGSVGRFVNSQIQQNLLQLT
jgi:hypothetical protein